MAHTFALRLKKRWRKKAKRSLKVWKQQHVIRINYEHTKGKSSEYNSKLTR